MGYGKESGGGDGVVGALSYQSLISSVPALWDDPEVTCKKRQCHKANDTFARKNAEIGVNLVGFGISSARACVFFAQIGNHEKTTKRTTELYFPTKKRVL